MKEMIRNDTPFPLARPHCVANRGSWRGKGQMAGVGRPLGSPVCEPYGRRLGIRGSDGVPWTLHSDIQEHAASRMGGVV